MARSKNTRAEVTNAYEHAVDKVGNGNTERENKETIHDIRKGGTKMNIQQHQELAFW